MLRGFFGSLIFVIIARILCGNRLNFLLIYTIFNVEETIQNVDVVKRNDFNFLSHVFFFWAKSATYLKKSQPIPAEGVLSEQQMFTMLNFVLLANESGGQDFPSGVAWSFVSLHADRFNK